MGIVRVITLGIIIWIAWVLYRRFKQQKEKLTNAKRESIKAKVASVKACSVCGVHVPLDEAINSNGDYFCTHCYGNKKGQ